MFCCKTNKALIFFLCSVIKKKSFDLFVCVEIVENSSLLSLVKTFDSVLDVYEGFCNLKQVTFVNQSLNLFQSQDVEKFCLFV